MRTFTLLAIIASYAAAISEDVAPAADATAVANEVVDQAAADANKAAADAAAVALIDDTMNRTGGSKDAAHQQPTPDNYRPPPVQDHKRREARERTNIHDHALLKSMDLSFVSGGFQNQNAQQSAVG